MSITSAMANAVSGLTAASRRAEVVSSNVSNATTEGYGRREVQLASAVTGGNSAGVRVLGIERQVNQAAIADRRGADAELGYSSSSATFFRRIETAIGAPDQEGSLSGRIAALESALITAAAEPDNTNRLSQAVSASQQVAAKFNDLTDAIQTEREGADQSISLAVDRINGALEQVADLNVQIRSLQAVQGDASGLEDQRQQVIDGISDLLDLRTVARDNGQVSLVTRNGTVLVGTEAATLSFEPSPVITAEMTVAAGGLSEITIEGAESTVGTPSDALSGGALEAFFNIRDTAAPRAQSQLDAIARNLIERVSTTAVDASLPAGTPGLFTDAGALPDPLTEVGIAGRIAVNTALVPVEGGDVTLLRDGIGALLPGPPGDNTVLNALGAELGRALVPASGDFSGARNLAEMTADFLSEIGLSRQSTQARESFATNQQVALSEIEARSGVDTDQELQKLLLIEKTYAANARIIQVVDEMLETIMRL